ASTYQAFAEMRPGRGLLTAASRNKLLSLSRLQAKHVLRLPHTISFRPPRQQGPAISPSQTILFLTVSLWSWHVESLRFCERVAESHVDEPWMFELHEQGHVIEVWTESSTLLGDSR